MAATAKKKQAGGVADILTASVDQSLARSRVKEIEKEIEQVQKLYASDVPTKLRTDEEYKNAAELLIGICERKTFVTEQKAEFMEKVNELVALVSSWFVKPLKDLELIEDNLRISVTAYAMEYHAKQIGLRRAAARTKDETRCEELLRDARDCAPPKVAGIALTTKPQLEILDEKKIPDRFFVKVIDEKALASALENGEEIPGAKLLVTKSVRVTPKHAKKEG